MKWELPLQFCLSAGPHRMEQSWPDRNYAEIAYHSTKFLIRSQVPDIIQLRIEASLRDRLHWCGLQSLG